MLPNATSSSASTKKGESETSVMSAAVPKGDRTNKSVDVTFPVDPHAAKVLCDPRNRKAIGRLVSRVLRRGSGPSSLARALAEIKAEARAAGLTDGEIEAELDAHNVERRSRRNKPS